MGNDATEATAVRVMRNYFNQGQVESLNLKVQPEIVLDWSTKLMNLKIEYQGILYHYFTWTDLEEETAQLYFECWKKIEEDGAKLIYRVNPDHLGIMFVFTDNPEKARELEEKERKLQNPHLAWVAPEDLTEVKMPDEYVLSIWTDFRSVYGREYGLSHVFKYPGYQYISLLTRSDDRLATRIKDRKDFDKVKRTVEKAYQCVAEKVDEKEGAISCIMVRKKGFFKKKKINFLTQKYVADRIRNVFFREFKEVAISRVFYADVPERIRKKFPLAT